MRMRTPAPSLHLTILLTTILVLPSCREVEKEERRMAEPGSSQAAARRDLSSQIEAFTGAHTRIVWSEYSEPGSADTFATTDGLHLKGLDTRDGLGERTILAKQGNYSRPILSTDGTCILWTDKNTVRKSGKKRYRPIIYLTGWKGGKPIRIGEGYAVDCWQDPATGVEFVYAVTDLRPTRGVALEGQKLVRFPLHAPEHVETVYEDTPISPDNLQFSRDGTMASALLPWPHAGVLRLANGRWTAHKFSVGCWTSLAPDNSGLAWVFDGEHKSVTMFAQDGTSPWPLGLADAPGIDGRELYHPRWSNHPRYFTFTGPYTKQKGQNGSVINKGGSTAQVHLARLSPRADKVEAWLQITHDKSSESYPDVWIAGAESARLEGYSLASARLRAPVAEAWPSRREGLVFIWRDREALNTFQTSDARNHDSRVENRDAGRYGRLNEMRLDGGWFEVESEGAEAALQHFRDHPEATFEALVLPSTAGQGGQLFAAPGLSVFINAGSLTIGLADGAWKSAVRMPDKPFHLCLRRLASGAEAFVDGAPVELTRAGSPVAGATAAGVIVFGGGWDGGLLNVALYSRVLTEEEIAANAEAAQSRSATFSAAPAQVRLEAKLTEASSMPTPEGIAPYTSSLLVCVYEVVRVIEGELKARQVLVKHWAMLDQKVVRGFPREVGRTYELLLERESDHAHLKGERVMDDTTAFDLEPWFEVTPPRVE